MRRALQFWSPSIIVGGFVSYIVGGNIQYAIYSAIVALTLAVLALSFPDDDEQLRELLAREKLLLELQEKVAQSNPN